MEVVCTLQIPERSQGAFPGHTLRTTHLLIATMLPQYHYQERDQKSQKQVKIAMELNFSLTFH